MTLFSSKNRDMPTLSLKGRVCVPLFLFIFVISQLILPSIYAQALKNRTEDMHHFGKIIIASQALPDKVYEAQKNKVLVSVLFLEKGTSSVITTSLGTGYVSETPGVIITARHVLTEARVEAEKVKAEKVKSNSKFDYEYTFMGTIITDTAWINFPLSLVAIGETGTFKDIMALRTDIVTIQKAQMSGDVINPNPYSILMRTSKFADANIGDKVYISGFAPVVGEYADKNNQPAFVYVDMINYTFLAEVTAKIEDMSVNKTGIKLLYRLHDSVEPGFSGGKVMNDNGQVIGMTISMTKSQNFIYLISSKDIEQFLKDNKIK